MGVSVQDHHALGDFFQRAQQDDLLAHLIGVAA
jgi:hypothetical protein